MKVCSECLMSQVLVSFHLLSGRKTKGKLGAKNEKAKLDREWNKISAIIDKRKNPSAGEGSSAKKSKVD